MGYEDTLLQAGFVPAGVTPKRIGASGQPTWQSQGQEDLNTLNQVVGTFFQSMQQAQERKQKKIKDQFDTYKTLREAGYDPQSAHNAILKGKFPAAAGGVTLKEQETQAKMAKMQADTGLSKAKTGYYQQGGPKRTVIDRMTPNQLQARLKYIDEALSLAEDENEKTSLTDEKKYVNEKIQQIAGYSPQQTDLGESDSPDGTVAKNPKTGKRIVTKKGRWVNA